MEDFLNENTETREYYQRLIAIKPNLPEKYIKYMDYYLSMEYIEIYRKIDKREFDSIGFIKEGEELNF